MLVDHSSLLKLLSEAKDYIPHQSIKITTVIIYLPLEDMQPSIDRIVQSTSSTKILPHIQVYWEYSAFASYYSPFPTSWFDIDNRYFNNAYYFGIRIPKYLHYISQNQIYTIKATFGLSNFQPFFDHNTEGHKSYISHVSN